MPNTHSFEPSFPCKHCDDAPEGTRHIGWARKNSNGGEIIFRQAIHPGNEDTLIDYGWVPVYVMDKGVE